MSMTVAPTRQVTVTSGGQPLLGPTRPGRGQCSVGIDPCPPRRGNRKGLVEATIRFITQRWWRTARVATLEEAQVSLDAFAVTVGDARRRTKTTVGELAEAEPLLGLPPVAYPAELALVHKVADNDR
jgi:hypothetical protein